MLIKQNKPCKPSNLERRKVRLGCKCLEQKIQELREGGIDD